MADFDNRLDREDGIRTMDALDKLLKDIPSDYDEVDVANHLLHFREQAKAELSALRERAEKAEAERDALKEFVSNVRETLELHSSHWEYHLKRNLSELEAALKGDA